MAQHRFRAFVEGRQWGDTLRDFVDHAQDDPNLPDATSWQELETYLKKCEATDKVLGAAEYLWQQYVADSSNKAH